MTSIEQLEEATKMGGEVMQISMSGADNAALTILEQGKPRPDNWNLYPEYKDYWVSSIVSLLSDNVYEDDVVKYFESIGIVA